METATLLVLYRFKIRFLDYYTYIAIDMSYYMANNHKFIVIAWRIK